jgi:ubiquinone/menaquinone biosynthesis C-methylase UbiE
MNSFENWFCGSSLWRSVTRDHLLPWVLQDTPLGQHVLEIGSGPGATTGELRKLAPRVTSIEYNHKFAAELAQRDFRGVAVRGVNGSGAQQGLSARNPSAVLQGDASALPFPASTFSAATAILVLHHLRSPEAQEQAIAEVFRVLRPSGVLFALEIPDGWFNRFIHIGSTFTPAKPTELSAKLAGLGFAEVVVGYRRGAFRVKAVKRNESLKI